ncbi:MAG TPA: aldose epimerase family protein [Chitinophagaceae bacterium]|nr:aldose epimerase family protein [Chitinophagaceae bacterium]
MGIKKTRWGRHGQQDIFLLTLSNGFLEVSVTNFGCTIVSILLPDATGNKANLVLGYDSLQGYINDPYYMGCIVGRFANRIANARFVIAGREYILAANETISNTHLHGGPNGFHKKVFTLITTPDNNEVRFYYKSVDGEEGYPGNLDVFVTYRLTAANELVIEYNATTDKTTPVNLTNHSYFNLSGSATSALNHELIIHADFALEADENYIPTGQLKAVAGTGLDFTKWRRIGEWPDKKAFRGYNECFSFPHAPDQVKAALRDPVSQRSMTVKTTLPGMMLYTGDFLKTPYIPNQGICLETQFFPDSPNQPAFPQTLLQPGDTYHHRTVYRFFDSFM